MPKSLRNLPMRIAAGAASIFLLGMLPSAASANLSHGSPAGVVAWGLIALTVLLSPPFVAAFTARSGERARDLKIAFIVWIALNVASCSVPTGKYGAASTLVRFDRFKAMAMIFVLTILAIRVWQHVRRRQASSK